MYRVLIVMLCLVAISQGSDVVITMTQRHHPVTRPTSVLTNPIANTILIGSDHCTVYSASFVANDVKAIHGTGSCAGSTTAPIKDVIAMVPRFLSTIDIQVFLVERIAATVKKWDLTVNELSVLDPLVRCERLEAATTSSNALFIADGGRNHIIRYSYGVKTATIVAVNQEGLTGLAAYKNSMLFIVTNEGVKRFDIFQSVEEKLKFSFIKTTTFHPFNIFVEHQALIITNVEASTVTYVKLSQALTGEGNPLVMSDDNLIFPRGVVRHQDTLLIVGYESNNTFVAEGLFYDHKRSSHNMEVLEEEQQQSNKPTDTPRTGSAPPANGIWIGTGSAGNAGEGAVASTSTTASMP
eukprot:PhF_6_TR11251/c0_g1_i1/m.18150